MHKRNIWYELHGWSPKYHTADLKHEIPRRLKDRIMFGADYPLLGYERLVRTGTAKATRRTCWRSCFTATPSRSSTAWGLSWT